MASALSSLFNSAAIWAGGFAATYTVLKAYDHLPRTGKFHAWQHKKHWFLAGQIKRYRGVDGRSHQGLFCTDCGELIVREDPVPGVAPAPWPDTMPAHEAHSLFYHVAYNSRTWGSKSDNNARLRHCNLDPGFDDAVRRELFARGYTAADLARSLSDDWTRWDEGNVADPGHLPLAGPVSGENH